MLSELFCFLLFLARTVSQVELEKLTTGLERHASEKFLNLLNICTLCSASLCQSESTALTCFRAFEGVRAVSLCKGLLQKIKTLRVGLHDRVKGKRNPQTHAALSS